MPSHLERGSEQRWTIKPELLTADNGAQITMGLAYGPAPDEALEVVPAAKLIELAATRDELRLDAEMQIARMREAAARLKPLLHRALTESGPDGDQARRDMADGIQWLKDGCPRTAEEDMCVRCSGTGRDDGGPCGRCGGDGTDL